MEKLPGHHGVVASYSSLTVYTLFAIQGEKRRQQESSMGRNVHPIT
jgi:hypothetical protein